MLHTAPSEHPPKENYVCYVVLCVCIFIIVLPIGVTLFSLQDLLPPADSVLFGPTPIGEITCLVLAILISLVAATAVALILTIWIRRGLGMPDMAPIPAPAAAALEKSINWRLAGGIAGVILILVRAKGFGSYFHMTENGISVRPALEFSMRH